MVHQPNRLIGVPKIDPLMTQLIAFRELMRFVGMDQIASAAGQTAGARSI
jgi:hypothetical protein